MNTYGRCLRRGPSIAAPPRGGRRGKIHGSLEGFFMCIVTKSCEQKWLRHIRGRAARGPLGSVVVPFGSVVVPFGSVGGPWGSVGVPCGAVGGPLGAVGGPSATVRAPMRAVSVPLWSDGHP